MHRVLLVEDDGAVRALVGLAIDGHDVALVAAPDLAAARRHLAEPPDLVILDLDLPDGNGLDLLDEIRADDRLSHTKVAILTGSDRDPQEGYERGANAWLQKPQDAAELEARVHHALDLL